MKSAKRLLRTRVDSEFSKLFGFGQVVLGFRNPTVDVYLPVHKIGIQIDGDIIRSPKTGKINTQGISPNPEKIADMGVTLFRLRRRELAYPLYDASLEIQFTNGEDHLVSMMALANCMLVHKAISEEVRGKLQTYVDSNTLVNEAGYDHEIDRMVQGKSPSPGASLGDIVDMVNDTQERRRNGEDCRYEMGWLMSYRKSKKWGHLKIEWDDEKNSTDPTVKNATIYDYYPGSKDKVWWRCDKGHSWHAIIKNRTNGSGCPKCSRSRVGEGNDLASRIEQEAGLAHLKQEWMDTKNVDEFGLTLSDVTPASNKNVWWKCTKAGHEWEARIANRVNGTGCPICAGRKWKTTEAVRGVVDAADYDKVVPQIESVVNEHLQEGDRRMEELQRELLQLERERDILEQKLKLQQEVKELKKQIRDKGGE